MRPVQTNVLKIASFLMIGIGCIHPAAHFLSKAPLNETEQKMFQLMSIYQKPILGGSMSMMEVIDGLNLCYGAFFFLLGSITHMMLRSGGSSRAVRVLARMECLFFLLVALLSLVYFYWLPVCYSLILSFATAFAGWGVTTKSDRLL